MPMLTISPRQLARRMEARAPLQVLLLLLMITCKAAQDPLSGSSKGGAAAGAAASHGHPVPLVLPVPGSTQLAVQPEGLALLNGLHDPVAPVVVIGPYRSGKSFTLNQILGVPCDQGFGVGHTRDTQTKGIWLWSEPQRKPLPGGGGDMAVLYVDTEGFESTGKSNSYDDRVFAVSSLLSSLLIYNLPETIRESDISKLSFAVELAQGLYERQAEASESDEGGGSGGGLAEGEAEKGAGTATHGKAAEHGGSGFAPGAMLWLIQRDFLQGRTAAELVAQVLAPVPNPKHDAEIDAVNQIRKSLSAIASNSTGYSLAQPHLERTRLCELKDSELDPKYVKQRDGLRTLVTDLVRPKTIGGRPYSGRQLATLLEQLVKALNSQEIPNVASMLEVFNRDLVARCVRQYRSAVEAFVLPAEEADLEEKEGQGALEEELLTALIREYHVKQTENLAASNALCSEMEQRCETDLDSMQGMRLPSVRAFNATFNQCRSVFESRCRGPARPAFQDRLTKALARSQAQFNKDYNDRLYTGLLFLSLGLAVFFRFVLHVRVLEAVSWVSFVFLELYPHLNLGSRSMYDTHWWHVTVRVWELLMCVLFGFRGAWLLWLTALVGGLGYKQYARYRQQYAAAGSKGRKRTNTYPAHSARDLDV